MLISFHLTIPLQREALLKALQNKGYLLVPTHQLQMIPASRISRKLIAYIYVI